MTKNTFLLLGAIVVLSALWMKIILNLLKGKGAKPFYGAPWDLSFNQKGKPILKPKNLFVNEPLAKIYSVVWLIGMPVFILILFILLFEELK
ncbi:hypothetical protein ISS85_01860 [Candidatus Microgenomates bacterium]|nr:hypothetical protein [Candidatus Microgenomates bacterium]